MATAVEVVFALLALGGLVYTALALLAARSFTRAVHRRARATAGLPPFAPGVSLLKPLQGVDPDTLEALRSHCRQSYAGTWELIFGVNTPDDPAVAVVHALGREFPAVPMRLVVSAGRLGTNGKVSNLIQMETHAQHPFVLVNDSDIHVGPLYLAQVMQGFAEERVGMVTALYRGQTRTAAHPSPSASHDPITRPAPRVARSSLWSRLEALGIATDFAPGVLTARMLEGGIRFGLGSTLAMRRSALAAAGGFPAILDTLADDYELGRRISAAGFQVELAPEVVATTVPAYTARGFREHQMRWARTVRDSRQWGYLGLGITFALPWALAASLASGLALWSLALLSLVLAARVAVALGIGVGILGDGEVLRDLWLLPLRDIVALLVWMASFAGDTVVWRGERFRLHRGRLLPLNDAPASMTPHA